MAGDHVHRAEMEPDDTEMKAAYQEWHAAAKALMAAAEDLLASGASVDKDKFDRLAARWADAKARYAQLAVDDPDTDWAINLD